jgi:hypothetical protein
VTLAHSWRCQGGRGYRGVVLSFSATRAAGRGKGELRTFPEGHEHILRKLCRRSPTWTREILIACVPSRRSAECSLVVVLVVREIRKPDFKATTQLPTHFAYNKRFRWRGAKRLPFVRSSRHGNEDGDDVRHESGHSATK